MKCPSCQVELIEKDKNNFDMKQDQKAMFYYKYLKILICPKCGSFYKTYGG